MCVIGALHLVWPSAFQFLFGAVVLLFGWIAWNTSPSEAVRILGKALFPLRETVYVVKKEKPKQSTRVIIPKGAKILGDDETDLSKPIPKPADPTPEELAQWARADAAKTNLGPSTKMKDLPDLFPDETPF